MRNHFVRIGHSELRTINNRAIEPRNSPERFKGRLRGRSKASVQFARREPEAGEFEGLLILGAQVAIASAVRVEDYRRIEIVFECINGSMQRGL